ncbi:cell division protein SepF, partial [Staphylococcus sp. SIMBA_130]
MGIKTKFKQFFELDDETIELDEQQENEAYMEEEEPEVSRANRKSKQNVVSLQSVHKNSRVVLVEPRVYAEAQDIADHVKNRKS